MVSHCNGPGFFGVGYLPLGVPHGRSFVNLKSNKLSSAVRMALSVGAIAALGVSGSAFAQNATDADTQDTTSLQAVVVTGSHIRRVDMETASPVITVGIEEIEASGALTLGDLVQ